jgi:alpha-galactosidase
MSRTPLKTASCLSFAAFMLLVMPAESQARTAPTPPMGWNSWNHFADKVNDADVRAAADALVSTGMRDAGYIYVNIDDTWQGKRDAGGVMHPNEKFPDMKALAQYVHSKGLKIGIYSSPGPTTCGNYAGSEGHEVQDAKTYAEWGIDFLKYDMCSFGPEVRKHQAEHPEDPDAGKKMMIAAYRKMGDALKATGRPIVYSLCQYGVDDVWEWGPSVGASMWRTTDDINDTYERMALIGFNQAGLSKYAGPGRWNDPDMLEVGNGKMTNDEYKMHMSLWALLASPLLAGNDLSRMSDADTQILMNKDVIAIDQDALGKQGDRLYPRGDFDIWTKQLSDGRIAVGMFNRAWGPRDIKFNLADIGFKTGGNVRDVWQGKDLGHKSGIFTSYVPKHGVTLLIVGK